MILSVSPDRTEACQSCDGDCVACVLDPDVEWPPRTRDEIAEAEADGLAFAGADAPRPACVDETWERHYRWRTRLHNQARFGDGGLFDNLEVPA